MLSWTIGDVRITAVLESAAAFPCNMLLPACNVDELRAIDWLESWCVTPSGKLRLWIQAFVVEVGGRRIVVDTCVGNDKPRLLDIPNTDFLERFEGAGFARESIDYVLCTHLHIDHVGWNTMLVDGRWVPTFPNARYLIGRIECDYQRDRDVGDEAWIFADSIQPLFDHGLIDLVETDHRICDEVRLVSTPGHTPGHVSVAIASQGRRALISGDFLHHLAQVARPEWGSYVDWDPIRSEQTRRAMLEELADSSILLIGTHFPEPTAGYIRRDGEKLRFVP